MELNEVDWYASLTTYRLEHGKTQAQIDALFDAIAANSKITKGNTATGEMLSAGRFLHFRIHPEHRYPRGQERPCHMASVCRSTGPADHVASERGCTDEARIASRRRHIVHRLPADRRPEGDQSVNRIPSVRTEGDPLSGLELIEAPEEDLLANSAQWRERYEKVTRRASQ
jgi:iron(III) transport system substrate-binding protein